MARTSSSQRWLAEHFSDPYVKKAQAAGYRSRATFKLLEIQNKEKIIKPGMTIIDLGAAPGGWSQIAAELVGAKGRIIALDILPMEPLANVTCIQGDFREENVFEELLAAINNTQVDLVFSDMSPNISGNKHIDLPRSYHLADLSLDLVNRVLKEKGDLLIKVFQGTGFDELLKKMRNAFDRVIVCKPQASRARSNEKYFLGRGYNRK